MQLGVTIEVLVVKMVDVSSTTEVVRSTSVVVCGTITVVKSVDLTGIVVI